ncbi:Cof-type HAD-IIB family hydrolase [Bacillus spongiae]|uniref:Cof-type HAD-IIB family hydrolase n=1 Tax=Bacillus spongiae TaxID=2683610 RepID=A0ABU8HCH3_9BACI
MDLSKLEALVFDLDGTLLNSKKEVTERNQNAILTAYRKGTTIIFATARPPRSVKWLLPEKLQTIAPSVYYNGALVIDRERDYYTHEPIDPSLSIEIIEYIIQKQANASLSIESEDVWYSNKSMDYSKAMNALVQPIVVPVSKLKELPASKLLITHYSDHEALSLQFSEKANIVCTDNNELIQIMRKNVSKEAAVTQLCHQRGISMKNVMAFGDDWNDFGLLTSCGFPVAMGNGIPELKDLAYIIADTNDEDGVAKVIENLTVAAV